MVFPTLRNLEYLTRLANADAVLDVRRGSIVEAVEPVLEKGKPTLR